MLQRTSSALMFVVKISKFCNLRCSYCYEFEELGQRRRMSLADLRAFFTNVRDAVGRYGRDRIQFVWHGGEPFLIPLDYYERIGEIQRDVLGDDVPYANLVQTNLTVLTERHIEFLRDKRFFRNGVGVSFDVYGDQRVDTRGRLKTETVLTNLQRLTDAGIPFGAIAVLARNTLSSIEAIYRFYDTLGVPVQLLPFYKSASDAQILEHALSFDEITTSLKSVFDAWLASEHATTVHPIEEYLAYALAAMNCSGNHTHRPERDEYVFLVDTDGATYGVADTYDAANTYGNVFRQDFGELLASSARTRVVQESRARMARYCASCPYFGSCPGAFVAEATAEQRRMLASSGCPVRDVIRHIIQRVERTSLAEKLAQPRTHVPVPAHIPL
jgi:uncharacterized protein